MSELPGRDHRNDHEDGSNSIDEIIAQINDIKHRLMGCLPVSEIRQYTDAGNRNPNGAAQAARYLDQARDLLRRFASTTPSVPPVQQFMLPNSGLTLHTIQERESVESEAEIDLSITREDYINIMKIYLFFSNRPANRLGIRSSRLCEKLLIDDYTAFNITIDKAVNIGLLEYIEIEDDETIEESTDKVVRPVSDELLQLYIKDPKAFFEEIKPK